MTDNTRTPEVLVSEALPCDTEGLATDLWNPLAAHVRHWWYKADTEALEAVMSGAVAHFAHESSPVWEMIVGPSGSSKTSLHIEAVSCLPGVELLGDVNFKTFLPAIDNKRKTSLLHRVGSGILLWKDFTSFIAIDDRERKHIAAALREIYDGCYTRDTGKGKVPIWKGKMTVIAAATPEVERAWRVWQDLGERFLTIRLRIGSPRETAEAAARQNGHEQEIKVRLHELASAFLSASRFKPFAPLPDKIEAQICDLATFVAWARPHVIRNWQGDVVYEPSRESPTRLAKMLTLMCQCHAMLFGRSVADDRDIAITRRVAFDSIPPVKMKILGVMTGSVAPFNMSEIRRLTNENLDFLLRAVKDMQVLGILTFNESLQGDSVIFTGDFANLHTCVFNDLDGRKK